jgi:uncharacterized protein (DUF952 family)
MYDPEKPPAAPTYLLHMAHAPAWEEAKQTGSYTGDTLNTEGFIHCSQPDQLLSVANRSTTPFLGMRDLVLLAIDPTKLHAALRYEVPPGEQQAYPHLYGPLNVDAVVQATPFAPGDNGLYILPADLSA